MKIGAQLLFLLLFTNYAAIGQGGGQLILEECYQLAKQNYPLVKQQELIKKSTEYSLQNASKGYLPQISINGQATYQSQVTAIPISLPGLSIPSLSKDQYKVYGEINQPLYDGGMIKEQKKLQETNAALETQKLEVELYKLRERVNQLFFGVLLVDAQLKQVELLRKDIEVGIRRAEASIANGVAFKSNADVLKAEYLKSGQRTTELKATRKMYCDMLGLFINKSIDEKVAFVRPNGILVDKNIKRPELLVFQHQTLALDQQRGIIRAKNLPKFNLFLQAGYGRPALNMLSNKFESYYIGGIRMNWALTGLYSLKNDKAILEVNRKSVDVQKELFLFNTNYGLKQQDAEVEKLKELMLSDEEIIELRTGIKKSSLAQLENGVISSTDYLRELNAEDQARETKALHEIQLLMATYNQQVGYGN